MTIHLNSQVTKELVAAEKPDTVIVATGGTPCKPAIKGIDKALVVTAEDALLGNVATGDQIVVAGGGEVGSETAAHLAMQQRDVTIIEMLPKICSDLDGVNKFNLMKNLREYEVNQMTQTKVVEILDDGVIIESSSGPADPASRYCRHRFRLPSQQPAGRSIISCSQPRHRHWRGRQNQQCHGGDG